LAASNTTKRWGDKRLETHERERAISLLHETRVSRGMGEQSRARRQWGKLALKRMFAANTRAGIGNDAMMGVGWLGGIKNRSVEQWADAISKKEEGTADGDGT